MEYKEILLENQHKLLEAIFSADESSLQLLLSPQVSASGLNGSAVHKGHAEVVRYFMQFIAGVPAGYKLKTGEKHVLELGEHALVQQTFEIPERSSEDKVSGFSFHQTSVWINSGVSKAGAPAWLLLRDHTSPAVSAKTTSPAANDELAKAKSRLQDLTKQLDTAREQLIEKERLASIGHLTAGIAHEIRNPLNFVNNFSEIILELTEEAKEEITTAGDKIPEDISETLHALLSDIEANTQRVHEHGKRAGSIVRSMLLSSRGKSGKPIPTDINAMLDENTKLAYHAMRAADSNFNLEIKTDFDSEMPLINVVSQDISRALLNIINNGMYAANDAALHSPERKPVLELRTRFSNNQAEIRIRDNGSGIPPDIKEQIFEPFFTTKPSGVGTGLGLSMTNEIIQKHRGTLTINTEPGNFTEFIIMLPNQQNEN